MQSPQRVEEFGREVTLPKMAAYYLSHPRMTGLVFLNALSEGSLQRVRMKVGEREYRLGNYARSAGRPPEAQSRFLDSWSQLKGAIFGNRPVLYLAYGIGLVVALWAMVLRQPANLRPRVATLVCTLAGMLALAAVIVIFDGVENGRHLFLFNAILDITVCALLCLCV